jgi:hypothetical protein
VKEHGQRYAIRIEGSLALHRLRYFADVTVRQDTRDQTVVEGCFRDQPALLGLLNWLHSLGVRLVSVERLDPDSDSGALGACSGHRQ